MWLVISDFSSLVLGMRNQFATSHAEVYWKVLDWHLLLIATCHALLKRMVLWECELLRVSAGSCSWSSVLGPWTGKCAA